MRIVVQYALRRATNLSEVLLCHQKKKKIYSLASSPIVTLTFTTLCHQLKEMKKMKFEGTIFGSVSEMKLSNA